MHTFKLTPRHIRFEIPDSRLTFAVHSVVEDTVPLMYILVWRLPHKEMNPVELMSTIRRECH